MLTVKDICKSLGVSVRTVYRLIKSGRLPAKQFAVSHTSGTGLPINPARGGKRSRAGEWRFEQADVDRLLHYKKPADYVLKPDLMTVNEACEYLSLSIFTIYRLIKSKKLPAVKAGGRWKFAKDDVRQFLTHGRDVPSHVLGMNFAAPINRGEPRPPKAFGGREVMSLRDVCKSLGVTRRTIYRLIKEGRLPATKVAGDWRIIKAELARYMLNRKYKYGFDGIRGAFFYTQVLDKYHKEKEVYYVTESAYDGFVGNRQMYHDYKTLRSWKAIPKGDKFFGELHYRKMPVKGGFILTITHEQYTNLPKEEYNHWSSFQIHDKELKQLEL
jgi:excisionase family DNA binding protein